MDLLLFLTPSKVLVSLTSQMAWQRINSGISLDTRIFGTIVSLPYRLVTRPQATMFC